MTLRFVPTPLEHPLAPPRRARAGFDPALADGVRAFAGARRGAARGCSGPAPWPSPPASSRGSSPARSTPSTRRCRRRAGTRARAALGAPGRPGVLARRRRPRLRRGEPARRGSRPTASVATAALPPRPADAPLTPMYRQPLGEASCRRWRRSRPDLPPSEFRDATLAWLERHYRPEPPSRALCRRHGRAARRRSACSASTARIPPPSGPRRRTWCAALRQAERARRRARPLGGRARRRRPALRASPSATAPRS